MLNETWLTQDLTIVENTYTSPTAIHLTDIHLHLRAHYYNSVLHGLIRYPMLMLSNQTVTHGLVVDSRNLRTVQLD
jgi:hypothetical protein